MINRERIEEWIRQVEAMPVIAPVILRQIANRLQELDELNETLRAENLALTDRTRVREFERKIAEMELQLDMLRRQAVGGPKPAAQNQQLVLYNEKGQLARIELPGPAEPGVVAQLDPRGLVVPRQFGMIVVNAYDELLLVLSSGRTVHLPAEQLPLSSGDRLAWDDTFAADLRALEELVSMVPITRMSLFDYAVQTSRFGYARKLAQGYFKTFIANNNIGRGIKLRL